jgi:hypothetical protein
MGTSAVDGSVDCRRQARSRLGNGSIELLFQKCSKSVCLWQEKGSVSSETRSPELIYSYEKESSVSMEGEKVGILTAVEGCAAFNGHSAPPPAGWLAAIHRGSLSGRRDLGSP